MNDQHERVPHGELGKKDIPSFEWSDLDGKTLEIKVSRDQCGTTVIGIDKETGAIYVLNQQISPEGNSVDRLASELADALERSIK